MLTLSLYLWVSKVYTLKSGMTLSVQQGQQLFYLLCQSLKAQGYTCYSQLYITVLPKLQPTLIWIKQKVIFYLDFTLSPLCKAESD